MDNSTGTYTIPLDKDEIERLHGQQMMWQLILGGLYPHAAAPKIEQLLQSPNASVLDLGTGSGSWGIALATKFPHVEVVGFDLAISPYISKKKPNNFCLEQGDALRDLDNPRFNGRFDVVHCRMVLWHQKLPQLLVSVIGKCLKPGGVVIVLDGAEFDQVYSENKTKLLPSMTSSMYTSAFAYWLKTYASIARGHSNPYSYISLIEKSKEFDNVNFEQYLCPVQWEGDDIVCGQEIGNLLAENFRAIFPATMEIMRKHGISEEVCQNIKAQVESEMNDSHIYVTWQILWGYKRLPESEGEGVGRNL